MKSPFYKLHFLFPAVLVLFSCTHKGPVYSGGMYQEYGFAARASEQNLLEDETGEENFITDEFDHITDNPFLRPRENPLSTFSIDVDTAGYSIVRAFINRGALPPRS